MWKLKLCFRNCPFQQGQTEQRKSNLLYLWMKFTLRTLNFHFMDEMKNLWTEWTFGVWNEHCLVGYWPSIIISDPVNVLRQSKKFKMLLYLIIDDDGVKAMQCTIKNSFVKFIFFRWRQRRRLCYHLQKILQQRRQHQAEMQVINRIALHINILHISINEHFSISAFQLISLSAY